MNFQTALLLNSVHLYIQALFTFFEGSSLMVNITNKSFVYEF